MNHHLIPRRYRFFNGLLTLDCGVGWRGWRITCPICRAELEDFRLYTRLFRADPADALLTQIKDIAREGEQKIDRNSRIRGGASTYATLMRCLLLPQVSRVRPRDIAATMPRLLDLVVPGADDFFGRMAPENWPCTSGMLPLSVRIPVLAGIAIVSSRPDYWVDVAFAPSAPLSFTSPASISGTAREGSVLTAVNGTTNDPNAVISGYQWQSSSDNGTTWSNITGATAATYTPVEADETHLLRVIESATDSGTGQNAISTSAVTTAVADIVLAFTSAASISGSATVGSVLSAANGTLNDADASVSGYQWQSSGDNGSTWSNINGATSASYTPVVADQGNKLRVVETATDADGGPSTISNSPATAAVSPPGAPTGFTFAPATSSLQTLQGGGSDLSANTPVGTFTQTGGVAGDSFTYTLSGSAAFSLSSNQGVLSTGATAVPADTVTALSVQVNDLTNGTNSGGLPFNIVVGSSGADTINLNTLGIASSTPTMVYGLGGNDTLDGSGMSGPMWFVGGDAADTMTGGTGPNTYIYAAAGDSTPTAFDVITNFNPALAKIDLTGIGGTALSFLAAQVSTSIPAQSIAWQQSGGNTFVYVDTGTSSEALGAADMKIELNQNVSLASSNFLHN